MNTKFVNAVDVECTCWDTKEGPDPAPMEIIEIGITQIDVCKAMLYGERQFLQGAEAEVPAGMLRKGQIYVTPQFGTVSPFCTKITGITQETVDNAGTLLSDAVKILRKQWNSGSHPWVSWGDFDRNQFRRECDHKKVPYPFGPTHTNVKQLFAVQRGYDRGIDDDRCLGALGMNFEGNKHCGADDAYNCARLFMYVMWGIE